MREVCSRPSLPALLLNIAKECLEFAVHDLLLDIAKECLEFAVPPLGNQCVEFVVPDLLLEISAWSLQYLFCSWKSVGGVCSTCSALGNQCVEVAVPVMHSVGKRRCGTAYRGHDLIIFWVTAFVPQRTQKINLLHDGHYTYQGHGLVGCATAAGLPAW